MDTIRAAIMEENYEEAERLLLKYREESRQYDDMTAILDGAIGEYYGDRMRVWEAIQKGLKFNCRNYELYVMLGNYYLQENPDQSCLCYENALFYCDVPEDQAAIKELICQVKDVYKASVNKTAVIIQPCGSLKHIELCIKSIRMTTPESAREIIVVVSGSEEGNMEWLLQQTDIILVESNGKEGIAGSNQGILASSEGTDIFLLRGNTLLTANALFWLRMGLYERKDNGVVGSVSNAGERFQIVQEADSIADPFVFGEQANIPLKYPYEIKLFLSGFAMLVKRSVLNDLGLPDENLGNLWDEDYGLRASTGGYRNILCKNSFIVQMNYKFFQKIFIGSWDREQKNRQRLNEKWGFSTEYYRGARTDLPQFINEPKEKSLRILEIGCGCGALMAYIKSIYPNAEMYGIELIPKVAEVASFMGEVLCGNVEKMDFPWEEEYFDYAIMGDVLEHLMTPENVLKRLRKHLKIGGHIIVSMPNVKHYSVMLPLLLRDEFSYKDAGILDRTHVKMYTGAEINSLILRSGYEVENMSYLKYGKPSENEEKILDILYNLMEVPCKESFYAHQYLFKAVKK